MKKLTKKENFKSNQSESKSPDLDSTQNLSSKTPATNLQDPENVLKKRKRNNRPYISQTFDIFQTRSLIAAVKARPLLWKKRFQFHPSKNEVWQSALEELKIEGLHLVALKMKWSSLYKCFKKHSEKLDAAVGHDAVPHQVQWELFEELHFLYDEDDGDAELDSSLEEVSYIKLEPEIEILGSPALKKSHIQVRQQVDRQSFLAAEPSVSCSSTIPIDLTVEESQLSRNLSMQGAQSSGHVNTSTLSQTHCVEFHTITPHEPSLQSPQTNRAFCNHLSAELRLLSGVRSRDLRHLLMKTMHDFMDSQRD